MKLKKSTPIFVVEEIEPSLELWVDRLGFEKQAEVPDGDRLGFVILVSGGIEIMYQSRRSIDRDVEEHGLPEAMRAKEAHSVLFVEVDDLDALRRRLEGLEILLPRRETFYGATELWMREPGGHLVGFAEFEAR